MFDPSTAPTERRSLAVFTGGMFWCPLCLVAAKCNIRGFDVEAELAPMPGMVAPDFMAAKLIYRLMGYMTKNKRLIEMAKLNLNVPQKYF